MSTRALAALVAVVAAAGCRADRGGVRFDFERMTVQPKYKPYGESGFYADGRAMRVPPAGTVPRGAIVGQPQLTEGATDRIPIAVTPALLARGRDRFDVFCAACHGVMGDGESAVARAMTEKRPPSLLTPAMRAQPDGLFFRVATHGYGLMPGYEADLPVMDRWAVVAYVRALQLSQNAPADSLPADVHAALERAAGGAP